jgi:hypothetical protein
MKEHQKMLRAQVKYESKTQLELARLEHQKLEAEKQRAHDLIMWEHQMQLENFRRGPVAPMGTQGAPAYGAPPPASFFDPALGV